MLLLFIFITNYLKFSFNVWTYCKNELGEFLQKESWCLFCILIWPCWECNVRDSTHQWIWQVKFWKNLFKIKSVLLMYTVTYNNIIGQLQRHHSLWAFMSIHKWMCKYSINFLPFFICWSGTTTYGGGVNIKAKLSTICKLFYSHKWYTFFKLLSSGISCQLVW